MKLFNIFKKSKNEVVFYHEDFYRQVELASAMHFLKIDNELKNIPEPKRSTEFGFSDIYIRSDSSYLKNESLTLDSIKVLLDPIAINYFEKVESGYSSHSYKMENVVVWGFERFGLFVEFNEEGIILNIWLTPSQYFPNDKIGQKLFNALYKLGEEFNLYLIDWEMELLVGLSNKYSLKEHLQEAYWFNPTI